MQMSTVKNFYSGEERERMKKWKRRKQQKKQQQENPKSAQQFLQCVTQNKLMAWQICSLTTIQLNLESIWPTFDIKKSNTTHRQQWTLELDRILKADTGM